MIGKQCRFGFLSRVAAQATGYFITSVSGTPVQPLGS